MFPSPSALAFGSLVGLTLAIGLFALTWGVIRLLFKLSGLQGDHIFRKMLCILLLGLIAYIGIFIIFIVIGKSIGPNMVTQAFFSYGLPLCWVTLSGLVLGKSIRTTEVVAIGKIKAALLISGAGLLSYVLVGTIFMMAKWI
ncbi:MAG: hypothetical protein ACAH10_14565 [Methylophilaceae bacterium]